MSLRSYFAALILTLASSASILAQSAVIGTDGINTNGSGADPICDYYNFMRYQTVYTAAELISAGMQAGTTITAAGWSVSEDNGPAFSSYTMRLGHTSATNAAAHINVPLTDVFGPASVDWEVQAAGSHQMLEFTTNFIWDGVNNIVVDVCHNSSMPFAAPYGGVRAQSMTNGGRSIRQDNSGSLCGSNTNQTVNNRPQIRFNYIPPTDCSGTPNTLTIASNTSTLCVGSTLNLNVTNNDLTIAGLTHQWEENTDGAWNAIPGATSLTYSTSDMPVNTSYRLVTTCTFSTEQAISNELFVTINELPIIDLNASTFAYCPGESAVMIASGASTYSWSPAAGLNTTTGDMVGANPAQPTTYTVTGTDVNGCIGTASGFVSSIQAATVSSSYTPEQNCTPGNNVNVILSGAAQSISGMGTWEYQWLEADGETVALAWTASNEFNFIPATDDVYTYFYQMRSTSCPSTTTNPVAVNISIGFGVESADLVHVDCNVPEGSIVVNNPFGQSDYTAFYANDFSVNAGANTTLHGVAAVNGGRMVVTPSVGTSQGGFTILPSGANLSGDMSVSYLMTVDLPINNYGTGGADGMTYSFGDDANYTNPGGTVNGKGTKLRVSFDSANNGTENGNATGIYVVYGWTATNAFGPASPQVLAYSSNTALWKNQTDVPVNISVSQDGLLTLVVDGVTVFSDIQLPQAYVDADKSTWRHLFSAGTGGDANRHAIDNLNITYGSFNFGISASNAGMPVDWQNSGAFTGLQPGVYDIWMSNPADASCSKMVGTYEVLNNYPLVNLGADTTICPGTTITLDAGNPGSTYTWSNSNQFTQTIEVSQAGNYVVYLTNPSGCFGIGSIQVSLAGTPQASGIQAQGFGLTQLFAVVNAQNTSNYDWNFGDGTIVNDGASVQNHTYTEDGTYTVTVTLSNEFGCTETVLTQTITVANGFVAIMENEMNNTLSLYPNPASEYVSISSSETNIDFIEVMNVSGQIVERHNVADKNITIATNNWPAGVYFINVRSNDKVSVLKLVVQ